MKKFLLTDFDMIGKRMRVVMKSSDESGFPTVDFIFPRITGIESREELTAEIDLLLGDLFELKASLDDKCSLEHWFDALPNTNKEVEGVF